MLTTVFPEITSLFSAVIAQLKQSPQGEVPYIIDLSDCRISVTEANELIDALKKHTVRTLRLELDLATIERDALPILADFLNKNSTETFFRARCQVYLHDAIRFLDASRIELKENLKIFIENLTAHSTVILSQKKFRSNPQPINLISEQDIKQFIELINLYEPITGLSFRDVDLGVMDDDLFLAFIQKLVAIEKMSFLEIGRCKLGKINAENFQKIEALLRQATHMEVQLYDLYELPFVLFLYKRQPELVLKGTLLNVIDFAKNANSSTSTKLPESFDLSQVREGSWIIQHLESTLLEYKEFLSPVKIVIVFSNQTTAEIEYLASLINRLILPEFSTLDVDMDLEKKDLSQMIGFLKKINNKNIRQLDFGLNFSKCEYRAGFEYLKEQSHFKYIDFRQTKLDELGEEELTICLTCLKQSKTLVRVCVSENNLLKFGPAFLLGLEAVFNDEGREIVFDFYKNNEESVRKFNELLLISDSAQRLLLIKRHYRHNRERYTLNTDPSSLLVVPNAAEIYPVVVEILSGEGLQEYNRIEVCLELIEKCVLTPLERAELIKKMIALNALFLRHLNRMKISEIPEADRLDIFLRQCESSPTHFMDLADFCLYEGEHCAARILSAWKDIVTDEDKQNEEDDNGVDTFVKEIREIVVPQLSDILDQFFSDFPFIKNYIDLLKKPQDPDSEYAFLRMIMWFTWGCSKLANSPELTAILRQNSTVKIANEKRNQFQTFNDVMKQILDFAHPAMRYTLTSLLFGIYTDENRRKEYHSLIANSALDALLPALPLINIALQEENKTHQAGLLKEIKELLLLCHGRKFAGHYYRTIMLGLEAVSANKELNSTQKITLLKNILSVKSAQHQKTARLLENFITHFYDEDEGREKNALRGLDADLSKSLGMNNHIKTLEGAEKSAQVKAIRKVERSLAASLPQYYRDTDFRMMISHFITVQGLAALGYLSRLATVEVNDFEANARAVLKEVFELTDEQLGFYNETFGQCRNETALLTYYSKIQTLKGDRAEAVMESFKQFVQSVLSHEGANFYTMRYNTDSNPQLARIFKKDPRLQTLWPQEFPQDLSAFIRDNHIKAKEFKPNFENFVLKVLQHQHLDPQYYGLLKTYLSKQNVEEKALIKDQIEAGAQHYIQVVEKEKRYSIPIEETHAFIQVLLLKLIEAPVNSDVSLLIRYDEHQKILNKIIGRIEKCTPLRPSPFKHDVLALITGLKNNKKPLKIFNLDNWQLVETDNYWRLFLCGTDVEGSCQAVDGDPSFNQCLMGYVNNGHVKMVAILDHEGKTIARCMLKLFIIENIEDGTEEPAIFLEDVYPEALRPLLREALIHFAMERAKAYGLSLGTMTSFPTPNDDDKDNTIEVAVSTKWVCEGGMAPFEYVDALFQQTEGPYRLSGVKTLYQPAPQLTLVEKVSGILQQFETASVEGQGEEPAAPIAGMLTALQQHQRSNSQEMRNDKKQAVTPQMETI